MYGTSFRSSPLRCRRLGPVSICRRSPARSSGLQRERRGAVKVTIVSSGDISAAPLIVGHVADDNESPAGICAGIGR